MASKAGSAIQLRIDPALKADTERLAEKCGKKLSELIRDLLRAEIAAHREYEEGKRDKRIIKV